jgi:glycosyltransferase involved in cell wall biosynthesis
MTEPPLISICIPTYNGSKWIHDAIHSCLGQTYPHFELLVVDDASSDDTLQRVRAVQDRRIRAVTNPRNLGLVDNWNRCVSLARGSYIKFLFQDDLLYPDCLLKMLQLFQTHPSIGLVFAPTDLVWDGAPVTGPGADPLRTKAVNRLKATFLAVEAKLQGRPANSQGPTLNVSRGPNNGRELFEQYLRHAFGDNWIGPPSAVMVRTSCFRQLGLFNTRMHDGSDYEMWIRLMYSYDVGYIDDCLSAFRLHASSMTTDNYRTNRAWLDLLWLIEGLLSCAEMKESHTRIRRARWYALLRIAAWQAARALRGSMPAVGCLSQLLGEYLMYRYQNLRGSAPPIHCPPPAPGGCMHAADLLGSGR